MKKAVLFMLMVALSHSSLSQKKQKANKVSDIDNAKIKAQDWFKNVYVANNFKDPYSYKLMKIELTPVTYKDSISSVAFDTKYKLSNPNSKQDAELIEQKIAALSDTEKSRFTHYCVYIECYGRNGYGNIALSKYYFYINKTGVFGGVFSPPIN